MAPVYFYPPKGGAGGGVATYPDLPSFPPTAPDGSLGIDLSTLILYVFDAGTGTWIPIAGPGVTLSIGTFDSGTPSPDGAHIDANALIMQSASLTVPGLVNTGPQSFAGMKTFPDGITGDLTGTASGNELPIAAGLITDYWRGDKTFVPLVTSAVGAINLVGTPSFNTLDGQLDRIISAGVTDGGVLTDNGDGSVSIAAATCYLTTDFSITNLVSAAGIATATTAVPHGYITGNYVVIVGAVQPQYNGLYLLTVTGPTTFTYQISGTPVSPATGIISTTSENSPVNICEVPAAILPLTDHATNYIFAEFNLGAPAFEVTLDPASIFGLSRVMVWTVAREGIQIWFVDNRQINLDTPNRVNRRDLQTIPFAPAKNTSILSAAGNRNFKVSQGGFWDGLTKTLQQPLDTSVTDTFTYAYTSNSGVSWTYVPGQTQIDNLQYNNVGTGLAALSVDNYGVHWIYVMVSTPCTLMVVYGQGDYTKSQAFGSLEPSILPPIIHLTNVGVTGASPGVGVLVGRIIIQNGAIVVTDVTSAFVETFPNLSPTLDSLADVNAPHPNANDVLSWNGTVWVNANVDLTVSAGPVNFFDASPTIIPVTTNNANQISTLAPIPTTTSEIIQTTTLATNTLLITAYRTPVALGRTLIDAGNWTFTQYANVNNNSAGRVTTVTRNLYQIVVTGLTVTITGVGTSRTATSSTPVFVASDANVNPLLGSYIQTPLGLFKITSFTNATTVLIATLATYLNETAVAFDKWVRLFGATSAAISTIDPAIATVVFSTTQPSFPVASTDFLGNIKFGTSNNNTVLKTYYDGNVHSSNMVTPLILLHNQLAGLQGGNGSDQYFHLSLVDYNAVINRTNLATPSTIMQRDSAGNFNANVAFLAGANISGLTANQTVVTDGTKNLISLQYTDLAAGSTIVSRDASGNASFNQITASVINGNLAGGAKGSIPIQTAPSATAMHPVPNDYGRSIPDSFQPDGWRNADYKTFQNGRPGKNYIQYADFENASTIGWSKGTTGTLTNGIPTGTPTFGAGSDPTFTIGVTSAPQGIAGFISLIYNSSGPTVAGNMVASDVFQIDESDWAKVLSFKFYYKVISGTGNFSGTSLNSFGVAIYDVSASKYVGVAGQFSMIQGTGVGIAQGTFQGDATSSQFRLILYSNVPTAAGIVMLLDDFYVGPQVMAFGPPVQDFTPVTMVLTSGFGASPAQKFVVNRVGDTATFRGDVRITNTGSGLGTIILNLPAIYQVDVNKLPDDGGLNLRPVGTGTYISSTGFTWTGVVLWDMSNGGIRIRANNGSAAWVTATSGGFPANTGVNDVISFIFDISVIGWSSNTVMSADSDTRVVAAEYRTNAAMNVANVTDTFIDFGLKENDTHGAVFGAGGGVTTVAKTGWRFVVPVTGFYRVSAQVTSIGFTFSTTSIWSVKLYQNTTAIHELSGMYGNGASIAQRASGYHTIFCNSNDTIQIAVNQNTGSTVGVINDGFYNYISIERLSGPATIAASETVACEYNSSVAGSLPNSTTSYIDFGTKESDTHNAVIGAGSGNTTVSGTGWRYVCPIGGRYQINAIISLFQTGTGAIDINSSLLVNGIQKVRGLRYPLTASQGNGSYYIPISSVLKVNAGDYIEIGLFQNTGAAKAMEAVAQSNRVSITRIGN